MNRVVVTGMGAVSPFGVGVQSLWDSLLENKNGIRIFEDLNITGEIVNIGAPVPKIDFEEHRRQAPQIFEQVPEDDHVKGFFLAVAEAVEQSGIRFDSMPSTDNIGVFIADRWPAPYDYIEQYAPILHQSVVNGKLDQYAFFELLEKHSPGKKGHYDDPDSINHYTSRVYELYGPQLSIGTACASGNDAIGNAFHEIRAGRLDCVIAGGAYNLDLFRMLGFTRIGALTTNPDPETACSPFDARRSGFVMGSGCGILMLESLEHAQQRGADILCEVSGYATFGDAYRATDPDPNAAGATKTIKKALEVAELNPEEIDYINAHGTSTVMNDLSETTAIKNAFGEVAKKVPISSTKSMIGHGIMAAGALEGIVSILSIQNGRIHPTRNWKERDSKLDLDYVPDQAREYKRINHVLSNNFGFGGQNSSVVFSGFTLS